MAEPNARQTWGQQLRAERLNRYLTQTELADKVGVPQDAISRAETGRGGIDLYERLADELAVTLVIPAGEAS